MKKLLLLALVAVCIGVMPSKVFAANISIGATTWYANWDTDYESEEYDSTFLFGPVMAIGFTDTVSLTGVFLFGKFDTTENDDETLKYQTKRRDLDIALNLRLNDYFKLFGGIKYIGIDQTMWGWGHYGVGPAFGLGFTAPMSENLFLLGNISYFYLSGTEWDDDTDEYDTNDYGFNATLSLAYYINPITLSLGVRYQYAVTTYDDSDEDTTTKFYGITLAATYSFNM